MTSSAWGMGRSGRLREEGRSDRLSAISLSPGNCLKAQATVEGHGGSLLVNPPGIILIKVNFDLFLRNPCHNLEKESTSKNRLILALASWLSWLENHNVHQKVVGLIPSQGMYGRQPIDVSLSHRCFSLPSSLSKINKQGENADNCN